MMDLIFLFVIFIATMLVMFFISDELLSKKNRVLCKKLRVIQCMSAMIFAASVFTNVSASVATAALVMNLVLLVIVPMGIMFVYSNNWWRLAIIVAGGMFVSLYYIQCSDFNIFMTIAVSACVILITRSITIYRKTKKEVSH